MATRAGMCIFTGVVRILWGDTFLIPKNIFEEANIDKTSHCVFCSILIILIFTTIEHIIKMVIAQKGDYKEQLTDIKKDLKKVTLMTTQIQQQLNEKRRLNNEKNIINNYYRNNAFMQYFGYSKL